MYSPFFHSPPHEGAGPDRLGEAAVGSDGIRRNHAGKAAFGTRHQAKENGRRLCERDLDGRRIGGLDAGYRRGPAFCEIFQAGPLRLGLEVARPVPHHVVGRHRFAVVEFHVGAQLERIGQPIGRHLEALGEERLHFADIVVADEAFDDVQDDAVGIAVAVDARIVAAQVGTLRDGDVACCCCIGHGEQRGARKKKLFHCSTLFIDRYEWNPSQQARESLPIVSSAIV